MFDVTYTPTTWKLGFKVTQELYEDDMYNIMNKEPGRLARSAKMTEETKAADIFDLGMAGTGFTGGDGSQLFVTNHAREDGGTAQSNKATSGAAPSETNIETALVAMRGTLDAKGQKMVVRPDTWVVPKELEKEAILLMKSSGRTGTNFNEINPYEGRLKIVVWDYLDNTTAWYFLDSKLQQLHFVWRVYPEFSQDESFDTSVALYKGRERFATGFSDWRGTYGNAGA